MSIVRVVVCIHSCITIHRWRSFIAVQSYRWCCHRRHSQQATAKERHFSSLIEWNELTFLNVQLLRVSATSHCGCSSEFPSSSRSGKVLYCHIVSRDESSSNDSNSATKGHSCWTNRCCWQWSAFGRVAVAICCPAKHLLIMCVSTGILMHCHRSVLASHRQIMDNGHRRTEHRERISSTGKSIFQLWMIPSAYGRCAIVWLRASCGQHAKNGNNNNQFWRHLNLIICLVISGVLFRSFVPKVNCM